MCKLENLISLNAIKGYLNKEKKRTKNSHIIIPSISTLGITKDRNIF
jgi:hypothetical protein